MPCANHINHDVDTARVRIGMVTGRQCNSGVLAFRTLLAQSPGKFLQLLWWQYSKLVFCANTYSGVTSSG